MIVLRGEFCFTDTFNMVLDGYFRIGKTEEALSLFRKMVLVWRINTAVTSNEATYATMIHGLCKQGRVEKASELLSDMYYCDIKPDISLSCSVIDGLSVHGHLGKARSCFEQLLFFLDYSWETEEYVHFITALSDEGYVSKASKLLLEIHSGRIDPVVMEYNSFYIALSGTDEAKMLLKGMGESNYVVDFNNILNSLCKKERFDEAIYMLNLMFQGSQCPPDSSGYIALIKGLCLKGRLCEALRVLYLVDGMGCECDAGTYNALMDECCKQGKFEDAFALLPEMEDQGFSPNAVTLNALVGGFARQKYGAKVEELLQLMQAKKISPDSKIKSISSESSSATGSFPTHSR